MEGKVEQPLVIINEPSFCLQVKEIDELTKQFLETWFESEKYCSKCSELKPLSDFNKSKADRTGHQTVCRDCQRKINIEWKQKHRPKKTEHSAIIKPVKQKSFAWTKEQDQILRDNFDELGPSGIFDKSLLPGFGLLEIRRRYQDLGLLDQYGNRIEKHVTETKQ